MEKNKIAKYESNTKIKQTLKNGDIILLNKLGGWNDLSEKQKSWLSIYFQTFPKRIKACMESGIGTKTYKKWLNNDAIFNELIKLIEFIHIEELKDIEYAEAYTDSKTRARFLKAVESGGYGSKPKPQTEQNLNINVGGMHDAKEVLDNLSN